ERAGVAGVDARLAGDRAGQVVDGRALVHPDGAPRAEALRERPRQPHGDRDRRHRAHATRRPPRPAISRISRLRLRVAAATLAPRPLDCNSSRPQATTRSITARFDPGSVIARTAPRTGRRAPILRTSQKADADRVALDLSSLKTAQARARSRTREVGVIEVASVIESSVAPRR